MNNPIGPENPSPNWTRTVKKAFHQLGKGAKEWWTAPAPEVLPEDFQERLGKDINLLDIFPGGSPVGAITKKTALRQAARGWRDYLEVFATSQAKGDPFAKQVVTGLKAERKEMVQALSKMSKETVDPLREVIVLPRQSTAKAALGYKGKSFGKLYYYPGKAPQMAGRELTPLDPLEVVSHELLGHLQSLTPGKAGKFKKFFREINKELAKGGREAHERFAGRMGVLTERYHKMKPGPMSLEDVKMLTEMATSEAAWRPELAPFLRPPTLKQAAAKYGGGRLGIKETSRWGTAAEEVATIPGEPMYFLDPGKNLRGAKAAIFDTEAGKYIARDRSGKAIVREGTKKKYYNTLKEAQEAAEEAFPLKPGTSLEKAISGEVLPKGSSSVFVDLKGRPVGGPGMDTHGTTLDRIATKMGWTKGMGETQLAELDAAAELWPKSKLIYQSVTGKARTPYFEAVKATGSKEATEKAVLKYMKDAGIKESVFNYEGAKTLLRSK